MEAAAGGRNRQQLSYQMAQACAHFRPSPPQLPPQGRPVMGRHRQGGRQAARGRRWGVDTLSITGPSPAHKPALELSDNAPADSEPASTFGFPGSATDTTEIEHPRPRLPEGRLGRRPRMRPKPESAMLAEVDIRGVPGARVASPANVVTKPENPLPQLLPGLQDQGQGLGCLGRYLLPD